MAIYYIDGDNEPKKRFNGMKWLSENDVVYVFYADKNTYLGAERNRRSIEEETKASVRFEKSGSGKNATDFAIGIHAATSMQNCANEKFYLVSGDKDFSMIEAFLKRFSSKKSSIKLISAVWHGVIENDHHVETIEMFESIFKEQFGTVEGQNVYETLQELLYQKFRQEEREKGKRRWGIFRK